MIIKNKKELDILREGGKRLAAVLAEVARYAIPDVSTRELDDLAEKFILKAGGKPSFKGYTGGAPASPAGQPVPYPGTLCVSINDEVVHGLPTDRVLKSGDVVGLDIGMQYGGFYTDTAITVIVSDSAASSENSLTPTAKGNDYKWRLARPRLEFSSAVAESFLRAQRLVGTTKKSLEIGIAEVRAGAKVGNISFAVQNYLEKEGFGVVRELVGHGVGRAVHEEPEIPNWGKKGTGPELREGEIIAIEPMATEGGPKVKIAKDGWTWLTRDGSRSAHFEHTLVVTKNGAEVLTKI